MKETNNTEGTRIVSYSVTQAEIAKLAHQKFSS